VVEQVPFPDALQLSPRGSTSSKTGILRDATNSIGDVDAEYTQFKAQLVTQKFAKLSNLGYSIGCGTVDLLRMLSVEEYLAMPSSLKCVSFCQSRSIL
jgi:hypothetical protein